MGRHSSHSLMFFLINTRRRVDSVRFVTSIWPSVCGWYAEENKSLIPSLAHKVFQKYLRNLTSRSETIVLGTPWRRNISLQKRFATCEASSILLHGMK